MRVLITGMSATGKSTLVAELRRLGHTALDADEDGFTEPRSDGRWGWRLQAVRAALDAHPDRTVFFAGCSEEQAQVSFDRRVLLTAPWPTIAARLRTRTTSTYGSSPTERAQVQADLRAIEPLLRRSADLVVDTTEPVRDVATRVLRELRLDVGAG